MSKDNVVTPFFGEQKLADRIRADAIACATSHGFDQDTAEELADVILEAREKMKAVFPLKYTLTPTDRSVDPEKWLGEQLQAHANAMSNEANRQVIHMFECAMFASHRLKR